MFAALNSFLTGALAKVTDVYWPFVSMLLHGDSPQQFNQDTSTNVFPITANGAVQASTRTPFTGGPSSYGSGYFNGSSYLTVPNNAAFTLGTNDFTIECWINFSSLASQPIFAGQSNSAGTQYSFYMVVLSTGEVASVIRDTSGIARAVNSSAGAIIINTWNHVAFVRNGNTIRQYINGVQAGTLSVIGITVYDSADVLGIGSFGAYTAGQLVTGYISNFRLVNGTCLYPSGTTFTPPTAQLTAVTNTALLTLQTNVPQNNNQFFDTSTNNFTLTRYGNTTQGSFNPFVKTYPYAVATNGGSGYFDGTGDYIQMPNNAAINFGSGDFTVECWVWKSTSVNAYGTLCMIGAGGSGFQGFTFEVSSTRGYAWYTQPSPFILLNYNVNPDDSTWHHVAISRTGSTTTMFVDGISRSTYSGSYTIPSTGTTFTVGAEPTPGSYYSGYISNLRLVKGTGLYTANFTPPTAPLTAVTNTALLLGMSNGAIYDNAMLNNLETVASAQISTSVFKYGTGALKFNGTGDRLPTPAKTAFALGSGDFTIECWVNSAFAGNGGVAGQRDDTGTAVLSSFYMLGIGTSLRCAILSGATAYEISVTMTANVWSHVAFVRDGATTRVYVNGVQQGTAAVSTVVVNTSIYPVQLGTTGDTVFYYNGYIDDFRFTKGICRYPSGTTFTPPTAAFPNLGPTYPSGTATQRAIFGFGADGGGSPYSMTNIVSNTGVVAGDTTGVGTARGALAAAGYGGDKAIFGFGSVSGAGTAKTNLVSNTGVVATDTTGVGWVRYSLAASGYGSTGQAIFGFGYALDVTPTAITSLVSNTGVVAADTAGVGTARNSLAAAKYGTDKAIFGFGIISGVSTALTNLVSNTGVVSTDTAGVGTARNAPSAAGYGTDKAVFGWGYTGAAYVSTTNLVSNTGVVATDTTGVGTVGYFRSAAGYGGDKAIFGYGYNGTAVTSVTNLVSNTGVVATDTTGVGTARNQPAAAGFSYS